MRKLTLIAFSMLLSLHLAAETALAQQTALPPNSSKVDAAYLDGDPKNNSAAMSDILVVHVINLKGLLAKAPENSVKQLRLFINSLEIEGSVPIGWYLNGDNGLVKFLLQRTDANNKTWNTLLGYPVIGSEFFDLPVSVSTGITTQSPIATDVDNNKAFSFVRIAPGWFVCCMVILAIYFWVLFRYAKKTPMLCDAPVDLSPLGIPGLSVGNAPFSLAKVQMAFWFSVILASYIFIWLITDNYELLNSGTLVLIGIGAATGLSAISIDNSKAQGTITKVKSLQAQQSDLRQATALLTAQLPAAGVAEKIQYNQFLDSQLTVNINDQISTLTVGKENFINDILTDENGVSFHRLQMVAFTLVLGIVFLYTVYADLTMPNFSSTLLTMQGITAGTYLGFKIPEKQ
jgi:hypothetical protein